MKGTTEPPSRRHRLAWFVVLWLAGVATVSASAYGLKALLSAVYGG